MATFRTADVERERPDEEFTVECDSGSVYTLPHPRSVPGRDLLELDTALPAASVIAVLLGDDFDAFLDEPEIDGFALDAVLTGWMTHYGVDANRGNGRGSRTSSTTTGKRSKRTSRSAGSR